MTELSLVDQMESKFSTSISGQLLAEHHDEQSRDIRKLATILGPLVTDYESLLGILNQILNQGNGLEYDMQLSIAGNLIMPNNVVAVFTIPRRIILRAGLQGSIARCRTRPSTTVRLLIMLNDNYIGEVRFNEISDVGLFEMQLDQELNVGDVLTIRTHSVTDTRIKDVGITFVGCADLTRCNAGNTTE